MITQLMHSSGEWLRGEFSIPIVKRDPQAVGSAITYCRRYTLQAILCIPSVDDDGEAAMEREKKKTEDIIKEVARREIEAATSVEAVKKIGRAYWPSAATKQLQTTLSTMVSKRCAEIEEAEASCSEETV